MPTRASIERRLTKLEQAVNQGAQRSYADILHEALTRARLGLTSGEPPIVNPEVNPLGARRRRAWEWKRDGKAPLFPWP